MKKTRIKLIEARGGEVRQTAIKPSRKRKRDRSPGDHSYNRLNVLRATDDLSLLLMASTTTRHRRYGQASRARSDSSREAFKSLQVTRGITRPGYKGRTYVICWTCLTRRVQESRGGSMCCQSASAERGIRCEPTRHRRDRRGVQSQEGKKGFGKRATKKENG